jgi:hypothetical protein
MAATRRTASMNPVIQGSALPRTPDPVATKFQFNGAPKPIRAACCLLSKQHGEPRLYQDPVQRGRGATVIRSAKLPPVRAQGIDTQTGTRCWIPVARRAASMSLVLQGSALWRASDPADTKIQAERAAKPRRSIRVALPVRAQGIEGVRSSHTCRGYPFPDAMAA